MKKIFSFLAVATFAFFAVNCGGGSSSGGGSNAPAGITKSIYSQMQKGNYVKAVEVMMNNLDSDDSLDKEGKAEMIKAFAEKAESSTEAKGGLKSFEIMEENISEDGLTAAVSVKLVYGNGTEDTDKLNFVKEDGKWKLSMGK